MKRNYTHEDYRRALAAAQPAIRAKNHFQRIIDISTATVLKIKDNPLAFDDLVLKGERTFRHDLIAENEIAVLGVRKAIVLGIQQGFNLLLCSGQQTLFEQLAEAMLTHTPRLAMHVLMNADNPRLRNAYNPPTPTP